MIVLLVLTMVGFKIAQVAALHGGHDSQLLPTPRSAAGEGREPLPVSRQKS